MTQRVGVEFDGNARGAVTASRQAAQGIGTVRTAAGAASPQLRGLEHDIGRTTRGALAGSGAFRGLGRSIAFASGGFLGAFGLLALLRSAGDEMVGQVRANAQIQAALRSTGAVSGETAKRLDALAVSERRKAGVDTSVVKSAEAMLLRFTQVRDVLGPGNDIFGRATHDALDLAAALGTGVGDAAGTLGRALQDPLKGVTSLRRANIALTAEEIKHIQTLARHGKVLEAQKAILDAVERSYAGTAKRVADATPWTRLSSTLKDLTASGLRPLLPELDQLSTRAEKWADHLEHDSAAQQKLKDDLQEGLKVAGEFAHAADNVAGALGGWKHVIETLIALKFASKLATIGANASGLLATLTKLSRLSRIDIGLNMVPVGGTAKILAVLTRLAAGTFTVADQGEVSKSGADGTRYIQVGDRVVDTKTGKYVEYFNKKYYEKGAASEADLAKAKQQADTAGLSGKQRGVVSTALKRGPASGGIYVYGGTGGGVVGSTAGGKVSFVPGYDCSGYVQDVYKRNGIDIPRTSQAQFADPAAIKVPLAKLEPGDAVFFDNGSSHQQPDHVGIVVSGQGAGATMIDYFHSGAKAESIRVADKGLPFMGGRRWIKSGTGRSGQTTSGGAKPPTSTPVGDASTSPIPSKMRLAIARADVQLAQAALTPGKADDRAATAQAKRAIEDEIAWLQAKLKTNLGTEKRITLEDLLIGALSDLGALGKTRKAGGATISAVTALRNTVAQDLKGLPAVLDDVEQNAVSHLEALKAKLKVGLSPGELARTRAGIQDWGKVLKSEISKQAKIAAAAAQEASRLWERGWQNDVSKVLRDFQENVADPQLKAFDRATSTTLKQMQDALSAQLDGFDKQTSAQLASIAAKYAAPTAEEQALQAFLDKRAADQEAKQKAGLDAQIADVQAQLAALGVGTATGGGAVIDIATGTRTALAQTGSDIVDQQKQLTQQLLDLQDQRNQLTLDDQQAALQTAAEASRKARDDQASADEQAYQDGRDQLRRAIEDEEAVKERAYQDDRDSQRQHLQDMLDDQATALQQDLDDWGLWLEAKKKAWTDFLQWLADHGYSTVGILGPGGESGSGNAPGEPIPRGVLGRAIPFARGGRVPGIYVGRDDTVLSRLTPGETVIDRQLTRALERMLSGGGVGGMQVVAGDVYLDGKKVGAHLARPVKDEIDRQIGYTIQRG